MPSIENNLVASGDHSAAMALWQKMIPSLLYIWRGQYIPKVKAACRLRGFDGGGVRAPLRDLEDAEIAELEVWLRPLQRD